MCDRGVPIYAIVRSGGKQFRVEEGRSIRVPRLNAEEGARVELSDVLVLSKGDGVTVGAPAIEGARVVAEVTAQGRQRKTIVFKYKSKVRYRRKKGHRQQFTELRVERILAPGELGEAEAKPKRARKKAGEPEAEATEPAIAEAPAAEAPAEEAPKPRRTRAAKAETESAPAAEEKQPKTRSRAKKAAPAEEGEE